MTEPINLVTTTPSRFAVIRPELLPTMQVLQAIDTEKIIKDRMEKLLEIWLRYDPPNAAQYDLANLEFDPIKINQELNAFFELMVRDRVNQATRAITLAFAVGSDLDAIASRYPGGVPRLDTDGDGVPDEPDAAYRRRIWLSPNILSLSGPGQATYESYQFWALSAPMYPGERMIKDASAWTKRATGNVFLPIMSQSSFNTEWVRSIDRNSITLTTNYDPFPTANQRSAVYDYIHAPEMARMGLTDVLYVQSCKVIPAKIDVDFWLFPGIDRDTMMPVLAQSLTDLVDALRWLGADLTILALEGAFQHAGVYRTEINSPADDILIDARATIDIETVSIHYKGIGE